MVLMWLETGDGTDVAGNGRWYWCGWKRVMVLMWLRREMGVLALRDG